MLTIEQRDPRELVPNPENYRYHPPAQVVDIAVSLERLGQYKPVVINPDGVLLAGHGVAEAAIFLGWDSIAVHVFEGTPEQERRLMVADNELARGADDDDEALARLLQEINEDFGDLRGTGWDEQEMQDRLNELAAEDFEASVGEGSGAGALVDRFGVPPFSVLDARQGYWQDRKRDWLALGIRSELGRGGAASDASRAGDGAGPELLPQQTGGGRPVNVAIAGSPMPLDRAKGAKQ